MKLGKFLGFLVSQKGIKANPKKVDIQSLAGKVALLSKFILKASDICHSLFNLMKKGKRLKWSEKCEATFQQLKTYLANVLTLAKPSVGDILLLYLVVTNYLTSLVLVKEEGGVQCSVYYTSRSFTGVEVRYLIVENW